MDCEAVNNLVIGKIAVGSSKNSQELVRVRMIIYIGMFILVCKELKVSK